jgi:hypothetical protein
MTLGHDTPGRIRAIMERLLYEICNAVESTIIRRRLLRHTERDRDGEPPAKCPLYVSLSPGGMYKCVDGAQPVGAGLSRAGSSQVLPRPEGSPAEGRGMESAGARQAAREADKSWKEIAGWKRRMSRLTIQCDSFVSL